MNLSKVSISLISLSLIVVISYVLNLPSLTRSILIKDNKIIVNVNPLNPYIDTISASPKNHIYFKAVLKYKDGSPVKYDKLENTVNGPGKIIPNKQLTDENGEAIFHYEPEGISSITNIGHTSIEIKSISSTAKQSLPIKFNLIPSPVILVHGYREKSTIFNNLETFLSDKNILSFSTNYDSTLGIELNSKSLNAFIEVQKKDLFSKGILSNDFTIIAHSYGGLVSRYYTCSENYLLNDNINKLIFLSVPHNGTDIALLGENIYNDQSIKDLSPGSNMLSTKFPSMINKGLNMNIQTANILGQFDEVVTDGSANLSIWKIKTLIYNVGENARTFDNIIRGSIIEAPNHNSILNNQKIFEKILDMLINKLPNPQKIS